MRNWLIRVRIAYFQKVKPSMASILNQISRMPIIACLAKGDNGKMTLEVNTPMGMIMDSQLRCLINSRILSMIIIASL